MSCDYTDMMTPMDFTPDACQYVNRKRFDKWKLVGMQFSHQFVGDITALGDDYATANGPIKGLVSGCKQIEEINQNNEILGRGGWYFRMKRDGDNNSATYGILGHCKQTDAISEITGFYEGDINNPLENPAKSPLYESLKNTPMLRGWGYPLNRALCSCVDESLQWALGAFIEIEDGATGEKKYYAQGPITEVIDPSIDDAARARISQGPGFFTAWYRYGGSIPNKVYRTCEAFLSDLAPARYEAHTDLTVTEPHNACDMCVNYKSSVFTSGDSAVGRNIPVVAISELRQGAYVKLTSLPACNHFDKIEQIRIPSGQFGGNKAVADEKNDICYNEDYQYYNPSGAMCFQTRRCERAVIRIMPACEVTIFGPNRNNKSEREIYSKTFPTIEKHFDRWDRANGTKNNYKIFDELFDIPEAKMRIRVVSHDQKILANHYKDVTYQEFVPDPKYGDKYITKFKPECMQVHFLTGGQSGDPPTGPRGCSCTHGGQNENLYPVRPYNEFVYCPNNFTCEKSC